MKAGRRYLHRSLHPLLPVQLSKVRYLCSQRISCLTCSRDIILCSVFIIQHKTGYHLFKLVHAYNIHILYNRAFFRISAGKYALLYPLRSGPQYHGKAASDRLDFPVQSKLPGYKHFLKPAFRYHSQGCEHCRCYRQIILASLLMQRCRRQIDRDALRRYRYPRVFKRHTHPHLSFLNFF